MTVFFNHDRGGVTSCPDYSRCGSAENCSRCKQRVRRRLEHFRREEKQKRYIAHITEQGE